MSLPILYGSFSVGYGICILAQIRTGIEVDKLRYEFFEEKLVNFIPVAFR